MTPLVSHTQIPVPTQPSMVATPLPGATGVQRIVASAVPPSVSSGTIGPDAKGNGVYAAPVSAAPAAAPLPSTPLSVPIPANFSTNAASLSAGSVYATQALAQNPGVYETMVAASEVKYKPSNATAPEPAPNNLFAKMLAEEQSHVQQAVRVVMQAASAPTQAAQAQAPVPKAVSSAPRKTEGAHDASARSMAAHAYTAASTRNSAELGIDAKVEAIPAA